MSQIDSLSYCVDGRWKGTTVKRSGPLKRKTPLRSVSKKRQSQQAARRKLVREQLALRPQCEAGEPIYMHYVTNFGTPYARERQRTDRCQGRSTDIHEPLTRARGGSIVDVENTIAVCRRCHDWIHANPIIAEDLGLLKHSWK